jgi:hypothetical protein
VKDAEDDKIANLIFHAENNEDSILLNLSISYRERFPSEESKPLYFIHHDSTGKTVVNPHTFKQTLGYFLENNTFYQVEMFMKTRYGITSEIETNFEEKSNQILRYIEKINPIEITSDTFNMGHFIIYNVRPGLDLIHVYDSSKIYSTSWRTFFKHNNELRRNWYLRTYAD